MNNKNFFIWLAGFIDGEGCFYYRYRKSKGYDFWLTITQSKNRGKVILEEIKSILNAGTIIKAGRVHDKYFNNRSEIWIIRFTKKSDLIRILPKIIPYLKVKKGESKIFYSNLLHVLRSNAKKETQTRRQTA